MSAHLLAALALASLVGVAWLLAWAIAEVWHADVVRRAAQAAGKATPSYRLAGAYAVLGALSAALALYQLDTGSLGWGRFNLLAAAWWAFWFRRSLLAALSRRTRHD